MSKWKKDNPQSVFGHAGGWGEEEAGIPPPTTQGAVYKGRPANGEGGGGVVLKFRTFPDEGRGGGL